MTRVSLMRRACARTGGSGPSTGNFQAVLRIDEANAASTPYCSRPCAANGFVWAGSLLLGRGGVRAERAPQRAGVTSQRGELIETYLQLESMLNRIYQAYQHKKDACIAQIDAGGNCDYDQPEQLALRAIYPLSWLPYQIGR